MSSEVCPLIAIAVGRYGKTAECMGPRCAWWDPLERGCCMYAIATTLLALRDGLDIRLLKDGEGVTKHGRDLPGGHSGA